MKPGGPPSLSARLRGSVQNLIDRLRGGQRAELHRRLAKIDGLVAAEDWNAAALEAKEAAEIAREARHLGMLSEIGRLLEQISEYDAAAPIRYAGERRSYRPRAPVWKGEDVAGRTVLIEPVFRHLGQQLRHARFVAPVLARAGRCIVPAEPRLVPLLRRTFPQADIRDQSEETSAAPAKADLATNAWDLAERFANTEAKIEASFVRLRTNDAAAAELRAKYETGSRGPLIGISWGTTNAARETADLSDWQGFLSGVEATFVSLQYGAIEPAVAALEENARAPIIVDASVDQLLDMDRFSAQIAALDLVVTIDNTIAHTAGALGKRSIVVTNDGPSHWPLKGDRTPWYPSVTVVRRRGREWRAVFDEVLDRTRKETAGR